MTRSIHGSVVYIRCPMRVVNATILSRWSMVVGSNFQTEAERAGIMDVLC